LAQAVLDGRPLALSDDYADAILSLSGCNPALRRQAHQDSKASMTPRRLGWIRSLATLALRCFHWSLVTRARWPRQHISQHQTEAGCCPSARCRCTDPRIVWGVLRASSLDAWTTPRDTGVVSSGVL